MFVSHLPDPPEAALRKESPMNIDISARHFDLSDEIKNHVREKLSGMERFYDGIDDIHVVLEVTAGTHNAHVQLRGDRLKLDARAGSHDMYAAFDETVANLERQIRRFKDRRHGHPHRTGQEDQEVIPVPIGETWVPAEQSGLAVPVFLSDPATLPRLTTNQAMTEYELLGGDYLAFHNTETSTVSAVYRSPEGVSQVVELRRAGFEP